MKPNCSHFRLANDYIIANEGSFHDRIFTVVSNIKVNRVNLFRKATVNRWATPGTERGVSQ
jgi:hypothetical protein